MPQFRLTKKFATDCNIKTLAEPSSTSNPLDDWFIDRIIANRKKIAIITHAKTTFTFFIPYNEAGGAKNIINCFKLKLKNMFRNNSLFALALAVENLFAEELTFTKTVDKKILGNMNDFKFIGAPHPDDIKKDWDETAERINNMPVDVTSRACSYPIDRLNELLKINLPRRKK